LDAFGSQAAIRFTINRQDSLSRTRVPWQFPTPRLKLEAAASCRWVSILEQQRNQFDHCSFSLNEDDVVYLVGKVGPRDKRACVLAVNFKNKRLQYVGVSLCETLCYMNSNISKFFFVTTLGITIPKHSTVHVSISDCICKTFLAYIFVERKLGK